MKTIVQRFLQGKQLTGGIPAGDVIIQQFATLASMEGRDGCFLSFKPVKERLDVFLYTILSTPYPDLLQFCKSLLLLSHRQATVERVFSINKEVETCNLLEESLESLRLVCDWFWGRFKSASDKGAPCLCCICKISVQTAPGEWKEKEGKCCTCSEEEGSRGGAVRPQNPA
ncbi:hypothetical protein CHARACLAT_031699 [Characodon lateralis]|uniref:HAT C-terminal dimerisation domain-containing protein n=1 Tax=Characodon lateralis TaxID=208331 RepID=A0ABU7D2T0_9TELE|nr:hypothetical protein [Characodon lateralis]